MAKITKEKTNREEALEKEMANINKRVIEEHKNTLLKGITVK